MEVYYGRATPVVRETECDLRVFFSQSTGSIGPTAKTQLRAPTQEMIEATKKGQ
jgi:hypothetical protein